MRRFLVLRLSGYAVLLAGLWAVGRGFGRAYSAMSTGGAAEGSHLILWLLAYVVFGLALGVLAALDFSSFLASTSERFVLGTGARGIRLDPRLKKAETLVSKNEPLQAIQLLREYLADRPRDWHTAIRIAEIYQGPLNNPLAAVLEYEAILQHGRLPRAARPWILLRLGNAFLFLGRADAATERFEEILHKYPRSGAAEKARRRLDAANPEEAEAEVETATAQQPAASTEEAAGPPRAKLPPGFRPRSETTAKRWFWQK